jgi:hypothetical protein
MDRGENELWGRYTEWVARIAFALEKDRGPHHDARYSGGRPVEVKACKYRIRNGDHGKFFIRKENHEKLCDEGGFYVFVVYDPEDGDDGPVLDLEMKPAAFVSDLQYTWTANGSRRGEIVRRPPWTAVFTSGSVPREPEDAVADD